MIKYCWRRNAPTWSCCKDVIRPYKRRLKFARQVSRPLSVGYRKDGNRRSDPTTPFVQVQERFTGHSIKPQALGQLCRRGQDGGGNGDQARSHTPRERRQRLQRRHVNWKGVLLRYRSQRLAEHVDRWELAGDRSHVDAFRVTGAGRWQNNGVLRQGRLRCRLVQERAGRPLRAVLDVQPLLWCWWRVLLSWPAYSLL